MNDKRGRDRARRPAVDAVRDPRHGRPGRHDQPLRHDVEGDGPAPRKKRKLRVAEAWDKLVEEEADKRLDNDDVNRVALKDAEANGIVFLDEIDKIAVSDVRGGSVCREGVQRDLLPLIEGTTVATKYGPMKTDHILFIASRRLPRRQAVGPASRAAGPPADPGRAEGADRSRFRPHPLRHPRQPRRAISRLARHRRGRARTSPRTASVPLPASPPR